MDGFQGALLNVKLPHLADWTARRRAIARRYLAGIKLGDLRLPDQPVYGESVFHQFTVTLILARRDALREHLVKNEIGTDLIYPCLPAHSGRSAMADLGLYVVRARFAMAESVSRATCFSLPIFPELTDAQVDHVIATLNSF